jgi:hypothetical protein
MPFGFPSGAALKTDIINRLHPRDPWHVLLEEAEFRIDQIRDFRTALLKSGKRSVDAFLEHRTDFLEVGKAATACALLPRETEDSLFHPGKESWYEYFYTRLNAKFEDFSRNSVSVFTFNYDRSLEHYLFTALQNAYRKTSQEMRGGITVDPNCASLWAIGWASTPKQRQRRHSVWLSRRCRDPAKGCEWNSDYSRDDD